MKRIRSAFLPFAWTAASLLLLAFPLWSQERALTNDIRRTLAQRYPGERILNSCEGGFLGKARDSVVALLNEQKKQFRVVWVGNTGVVQELQAIPAFGKTSEFELQCLGPREAKQIQQTLKTSEAIRDFLRVPAGKGALCYFVDATQTKCWSVDRKGSLIDVGGWQT